jgi:hypothetical protein
MDINNFINNLIIIINLIQNKNFHKKNNFK